LRGLAHGVRDRGSQLNPQGSTRKESSMTKAVIVGINTHHDRALAGGRLATGVM
jgi:hypothetical protein